MKILSFAHSVWIVITSSHFALHLYTNTHADTKWTHMLLCECGEHFVDPQCSVVCAYAPFICRFLFCVMCYITIFCVYKYIHNNKKMLFYFHFVTFAFYASKKNTHTHTQTHTYTFTANACLCVCILVWPPLTWSLVCK